MKLRNKKTGEIVEYDKIGFRKGLSDGWKDFVPFTESLAELNEEWEDVGDTNCTNTPLINDEKIRKALRAWAELNSIKSVAFEDYDDENIYFIDRDYEPQIWFSKTRIAWELDDGQIYTIAELCGEDEE